MNVAHVQGVWESTEVVGAHGWRVDVTANKVAAHLSLALLAGHLWLPGSTPAGATLALVCAVHAALRNSVLQVEEV